MKRRALMGFGLDVLIPFVMITCVCIQAAFLKPYVVLVTNERTNLFSPLLSLVCLIVVLWFYRKSPPKSTLWRRWELPVWAILGALSVFSGYLSPERIPSLYRVFSFFASALSGYWCGRILSQNTLWNYSVAVLFSIFFSFITFYQIFFGTSLPAFHDHHHAMANMLILFAAGPITLFLRTTSVPKKFVFFSLLCFGFFACYAIGSRFVILLPFVLLPVLMALGLVPKKYALLSLAIFILTASFFFAQKPGKVLKLRNYESVFYRIEGIPTTVHILKKSPWFGIGFRASREPYLDDYEMYFDLTDKKTYMEVVRRNVTEDNMLTTMLVGLGLLPTITYLFLFLGYAQRLMQNFSSGNSGGLATAAIGFSLIASVIHFSVQDGLLSPQINWFFHLLVGMIPLASSKEGRNY